MNKESLKEYLSSRYQGCNSFLNTVIFPIFGEDDYEDEYETEMLDSMPERKRLAEATGIQSIKQVGKMYIGAEPLQIFDITVCDRVMMERNRVNIQRLIRSVMDYCSCAFMLFHYEDDFRWDWRFSYCRKSGNKEDSTDSKRYTFLLGPGQSCRTATENFIKLAEKHEDIEITDIEKAFDVEALSDEFFGKYKQHYERFVEYITGKRYVKKANKWTEVVVHDPHPQMYAAFGKKDKLVRDYVKKLLGRIVFLHFLQKKGWMGVPEGKTWGEGDQEFMLHLFEYATEEQKIDYLDTVLEPLFSEGLDSNRASNDDIYDTKVALENGSRVRIPYLNGGLFERDELDEIETKFPSELFSDLLNFLYQYNFTIDENDPDDAQVGVDPEMLGRIFENLLEDNKDKGAYYTPKEIVRYMCRQSLTAYLCTDIEDEKTRQDVEAYVKSYNVELIGGASSDLAKKIDERLKDVKICDPAIGSGAFPMGLLKELFLCRGAIENFDNAADIKRHIIQNNIYGVDIEKGAVDIARLRFWLSLVVDEDKPQTLPNLDFKIMQGNSLLEQYKGVDLSRVAKNSRQLISETQTLEIFDSMLDVYRMELRDMIIRYYNVDNHKTKKELLDSIKENVVNQLHESCLDIEMSDINLQANDKFFLWHTWFADVLNRPFGCNGFDIVIGNPPYVEAKKLKYIASTLRNYYSIYSGTADLSIYFVELAVNLLRDDGILCYITTNKFFYTGYGKLIRKLLCNKHINTIINFEQVEVFEDILVSSVILNIRKAIPCSDNTFTYERFYKLNAKEFRREFIKKLDNFGVYPQEFLDDSEWSFADITGLMLKRKIEKDSEKLADVGGVNIYRGVTTGYNPAFIIDDCQKDELVTKDERNKDIIKNLLQGRNIRKWFYNESNENLIFTRKGCIIENYPFIKEYLSTFYDLLKPKKKSTDEFGRKPGKYKWYEILDNTAYYKHFEKEEKIIWGLTANNWAFAYDDKQHYLPSNGYILTSEKIPIKYLLGWLNSKLIRHYFSYIGVMTAGGAYTLKAATIEALPLRCIEDYTPIIKLVDMILGKKAVDKNADTSKEEAEIDKFIYQLYGLNDEEIKVVEGD